MQAGKLDRRVQVRRAAESRGDLGTTLTWADHGPPVWASKADLSDGEKWRAGEVAASVTTRFVLRWSAFAAAITEKDRLVCEGRTYEIVGIKETGRRDGIEITAAAETGR